MSTPDDDERTQEGAEAGAGSPGAAGGAARTPSERLVAKIARDGRREEESAEAPDSPPGRGRPARTPSERLVAKIARDGRQEEEESAEPPESSPPGRGRPARTPSERLVAKIVRGSGGVGGEGSAEPKSSPPERPPGSATSASSASSSAAVGTKASAGSRKKGGDGDDGSAAAATTTTATSAARSRYKAGKKGDYGDCDGTAAVTASGTTTTTTATKSGGNHPPSSARPELIGPDTDRTPPPLPPGALVGRDAGTASEGGRSAAQPPTVGISNNANAANNLESSASYPPPPGPVAIGAFAVGPTNTGDDGAREASGEERRLQQQRDAAAYPDVPFHHVVATVVPPDEGDNNDGQNVNRGEVVVGTPVNEFGGNGGDGDGIAWDRVFRSKKFLAAILGVLVLVVAVAGVALGVALGGNGGEGGASAQEGGAAQGGGTPGVGGAGPSSEPQVQAGPPTTGDGGPPGVVGGSPTTAPPPTVAPTAAPTAAPTVAPTRLERLFRETKLTASDASRGSYFGRSVSISGDTAVVGAWGDNDERGAAYVYVRTGGSSDGGGSGWTESAKLLPVGGSAPGDSFGSSVAVRGGTVVVGAPWEASKRGGAYVFVRDGTTGQWVQEAKLLPKDAAEGDNFGYCVSLSGETVIVGAPYKHLASGADVGAAYVFVRGEARPSQQSRQSVGAPPAPPAGPIVLWSETAQILPPPVARDYVYFANSVSVSGDTAVVGAPWGRSDYSGYAQVFTRRSGGGGGGAALWELEDTLTTPDAGEDDQFGYSVSIWEDTIVVGALEDDIGAAADAGSAHVFVRYFHGGNSNNSSAWSAQAKLTASDVAAGAEFGRDVSVSGDAAIVGAHLTNGGGANSGSAYVFVRGGNGTWTQWAEVTASDADTGDEFGRAVSIWGNTSIVGARLNSGREADSGSAYVFEPL